jgi:general stress protein 26
MLMTVPPKEDPVSRLMALQETEFNGDLWCFAHRDSPMAAQIQAKPQIAVSFLSSTNSSWTSSTGPAEIVHDRQEAGHRPTYSLKARFPDRLGIPGPTPISVLADAAECGECPTSSTGWVGDIAARAIATRSLHPDSIDEDAVTL